MAQSFNIRTPKLIITIDGPAGSGKSTTARLLGKKLNYLYLDTGAMYRTITLKVIHAKLKKNQVEAIIALLKETEIDIKYKDGNSQIFLDELNVTDEIRTPKVDKEVSWVCQIPEIRDRLVKMQREFGVNGGIVAEGRDTGTVVFPDADVKYYLTANLEVRAKRRLDEQKMRGENKSLEDILIEIERRDKMDSERELSPLMIADDTIEIDTTDLTIEEQVNILYKKVIGYLQQLEEDDRLDY